MTHFIVSKIIGKLNVNKTPGSDGIGRILFKMCKHHISFAYASSIKSAFLKEYSKIN